MNEFAQMYAMLVRGKKIRVYEMARYCRIAPQSLYQILNGKRNPPSMQLVEMIADYIELDPIGREKLIDAYVMTVIGKEVYERRASISNFLRKYSDSSSVLNLQRQDDIASWPEQSFVLSQTISIVQMMYDMFFDARESPLKLFVPADFPMLSNLVNSFVREKQKLKIQHILGLYSETTDSMGSISILAALKNIIPLYSSYASYEGYYYYHEIQNIPFTPYLYYVVSDHAVLQISRDYQYALFHNQPQIVKSFTSHFYDQQKIVHPFLVSISDVYDQLEFYEQEVKKESAQYFAFHSLLALIPLLSQNDWNEMFAELDGQERLIAISRMKTIQEYLEERQCQFLFYESAVAGFLKHKDLPLFKGARPLSFESRLSIVKRMVERYSKLGYCMLKMQNSLFRKELQWFFTDSTGFLQIIDRNERKMFMKIDNPYLLFIFKDYFENIPDRMIYCEKEAVELLKSIVSHAENTQ